MAESNAATIQVRSIDLGWRARTRPPSLAAHVLGAGAGAFAVAATVALALEITSTDATAPGVLLDLALTNPPIWFFAFYGDGQGGVEPPLRRGSTQFGHQARFALGPCSPLKARGRPLRVGWSGGRISHLVGTPGGGGHG